MFKILKLFIFLFALLINNNVSAKPVPPGAGDGDEAANILFLVDSSASMGRWIGGDGLGRAWGVTYDSADRILIGQQARRAMGSVIRYTAAGARDTNFRPIRSVPRAGCTQEVDATRGTAGQRLRRAGRIKFVENRFKTFNKTGSKTDRGRVYLQYGEPDEMELHPNDYDKKPYEIWYYNSIEGGVIFVFGDITGYSDYELLHSTKRGELRDDNWVRRILAN